MAIEGAFSFRNSRAVDVGTNLGYDGGAKSHVRDEVAVHLER